MWTREQRWASEARRKRRRRRNFCLFAHDTSLLHHCVLFSSIYLIYFGAIFLWIYKWTQSSSMKSFLLFRATVVDWRGGDASCRVEIVLQRDSRKFSEIFPTKLTEFSLPMSLTISDILNSTNIWHNCAFVGCTDLWCLCGSGASAIPPARVTARIPDVCGWCHRFN